MGKASFIFNLSMSCLIQITLVNRIYFRLMIYFSERKCELIANLFHSPGAHTILACISNV